MLFCAAAFSAGAADYSIVIGEKAGEIERYAARELQRYLYQIGGVVAPVAASQDDVRGTLFLLGRPESNPRIKTLVDEGVLRITAKDPGAQGYVLRRFTREGAPCLAIAGGDEIGVLYGVYGLLEDHYGVSFTMGGDALPASKPPFELPDLDERKAPAVAVRGFLPWTNFPQSATVYSWEDWRYIIDQSARMRLNFIHVHNYNGQSGHNEMYHNFTYRGFMSRVWMPTAKSGHAWGGRPGWEVKEYLFGAADLFDDYDFGSECALHNESLTNEQVFGKGVALFQRVIDHAHQRGVRIGLGIDIDLIPEEYKGAKASDPGVIQARARQIASDYPELDYLLCFQSECMGNKEELLKDWRSIVAGFRDEMKSRAPHTRLAVSGWGLDPVAVASLPADVICAPISAYSDGCLPGSEYGAREYWGCPWLERDFNSSQYYYPYNMHLSNTLKAWRDRSPNMKGFYCLTWRLTDAIDAKLSTIAKAPWDDQNRYASSRAAYLEYARRQYGPDCAEDIVAIIDQNEPFASGWGECQDTPRFLGSFRPGGDFLFDVSQFRPLNGKAGDAPWTRAAAASASRGTQKAPCSEGGDCVAKIQSGDWLRFDDFDFGGGATRFQARVASATQGGDIELRLDDPLTGPRIGLVNAAPTGGWQSWATVGANIEKTAGRHRLFLVFLGLEVDDTPKADRQLAIIGGWLAKMDDPERRMRLQWLRERIAAARGYMRLNRFFPTLPWDKLPGGFEDWTRNFTHRVNDISSLGNVMSMQNRYVQLNYLAREKELRAQQPVKAPSRAEARGCSSGAVITWRNEQPGAKGFLVFRDGVKLTETPLDAAVTRYVDQGDGVFQYTVAALGPGGQSPPSAPSVCSAGDADTTAPWIVAVSPPTSLPVGQPAEIKVRLLDNRVYEELTATLSFRPLGAKSWRDVPMRRRVRGVFMGVIPAAQLQGGVEYFIAASDGRQQAYWPPAPDGRKQPLRGSMITIDPAAAAAPPPPPRALKAALEKGRWVLSWQAPEKGEAFCYRIYRAREKDAGQHPADRLTYVNKDTLAFSDNGLDWDGEKLRGARYYRVTAIDRMGYESAAAGPIGINQE